MKELWSYIIKGMMFKETNARDDFKTGGKYNMFGACLVYK